MEYTQEEFVLSDVCHQREIFLFRIIFTIKLRIAGRSVNEKVCFLVSQFVSLVALNWWNKFQEEEKIFLFFIFSSSSFFFIITATKRRSTTSAAVNTNNFFSTRPKKEFIPKRVNALMVGFRREKFLALRVSRLFSRILISKEYIMQNFCL